MSYGVGLRNGVAFALGTIPSLTSGGGLRPSLLLNFLSGALDSRITFSRGTQATQYTSNGTLQYAPNNLLTYSNQADNAAWTKSNSFVQTNLLTYSEQFDNAVWTSAASFVTISANAAVAPDGTTTADSVTAVAGLNFHYSRRTTPDTLTGAYTYSIYVKKNTSTWIFFTVNDSAVNYFNFDTGAFGTTPDTCTVVALPNGWYRISATRTLAAAQANCGVGVAASNGGANFTATGTESVYVWGAQLVQGSVPGDYRATTTAALPVLYADYNGVVRARKICEDAVTATAHRIFQSQTTAGAVMTFSVYAKAGERSWLYLRSIDSTVATRAVWFNVSTGVLGQVDAPATATIQNVGNGWYRCTVSLLSINGANTLLIGTADANTVQAYNGDGSSGIYIADAQLEAGSTVQAYNDTTSAAYYGPRFDYDPTNYVRQNLLTYSQDFTNAVWGKSNCTVTGGAVVAPDGTPTGTLVSVPATAFAYVNFTSGVAAATATNNTFVISVLAGTVASVELGLYDGATWGTGTATIISGPGSLTNTTGSRYLVSGLSTSQWTRVAITRTSASATGLTPYIYPRAQGTSQAGDTLYIWGAQLNTGSTALTYTATTTAPYTLVAARGLLIEEQRVNLLLQSNDFQTSWSPTNITRTLASTTGPDGTLSGVKIEATTAAATSLLQSTAVAATAATFSVYVKQGTGATTANNFGLRNITTLTNLVFGTFNYSTGVFTYTVGSTGVVVTNVGNGWWRIAISATTGITSGDLCTGYVGFIGNAQAAGDFLYAYGAQLEAGAFATSYIPTVGSQVTRAADSASITTLTPWFNATQGGFYAEYLINSFANSCAVVSFNASNSGFNVSGSGAARWWNGTTNISTANIVATGIIRKESFAYTASTRDICLAGSTVASDANAPWPSIPTAVYFGAAASGSSTQNINGWLRSINYYPTRLPNATLQGLTV